MDENKIINCIRYNKLKEFFKQIDDLDYAVIKGEVVSVQAYGGEGKRKYNDIDILANVEDLDVIKEKLLYAGFEQKKTKLADKALIKYSHQTEPFQCVYMGINVIVDINLDIYWGEYDGQRFSIKEFLKDTIYASCYGVRFKVLNIEKSFIHLCLHTYKDYNSIYLLWQRNKIDIKYLEAIYKMICTCNELNPYTVYKTSERCYVKDYICVILIYVYSYYLDKKLLPYIKLLLSNKAIILAKTFGLCDKERKEWKCSVTKRFYSNDIRNIIKNKLSERDYKKIEINAFFD